MVEPKPPGRGRTKADGAWKRVLTDLLPEVLAFTAPELHAAVDWSVPPVALDKEFQAIARQAAVGARVVDHLVQLRLLTGDTAWLVLHIEVQGQRQDEFAARMFTYYALLHLRWWRRRKERGATPAEPLPLILGLALLTDGNIAWRPGAYEARAFDRGVRYDYWVIKVADWRGREADLAASPNPFALVLRIWLGRQAAGRRTDDLKAVAREAFRQLRRDKADDTAVAAVLAFLYQVLPLSTALLEQEITVVADEEGIPMAQVMSPFERAGLRKGRQEGRQEERLDMTLLFINHRFGPLDEATANRVRALDADQLLALYTAALDFAGRADLDRWLAQESDPE